MSVKMAETMFFSTNNLVFNLQGLQFPQAGQYSIDISLDGEIIARIPLQVLIIEQNRLPPQ
mgnify:FL=1